MALVTALNNTGGIFLLELDASPLVAATLLPNGESIPPGSIGFANVGGVGKGFIKTALTPDTAWSELDQNNADWNLIGNVLTGALPTTPNELFGSNNDFDVRYIRNNAEIIRLASEGLLVTKGNYADYATLPAAYRAQAMNLLATNGGNLESASFPNGGVGARPIQHTSGSAGELTTAGVAGTLNLSNIPVQTGSVMLVFGRVVGRQTAGSAGVVGNVFTYTIIATVRNVGGVVTIRSQSAVQTSEDDSGGAYDVLLAVNTTNVRAVIAQPANRVVKWFGHFDCIQATT